MISKSDGAILQVRIIHIGYNGTTPLPPPHMIKWDGGVTEFIHVSGKERVNCGGSVRWGRKLDFGSGKP